jgi:hypothetical protein
MGHHTTLHHTTPTIETKTKKFELGAIEVRTVVLEVSPSAATYTSAKTVYWNSSDIQWKFHSTLSRVYSG